VYTCKACGAKLTTKSSMTGHTKICKQKQKQETLTNLFSCDICGDEMTLKQAKGRHSLAHSFRPDALHRKVCPVCGEGLKGGKELVVHMKKVHKETCTVCGKLLNMGASMKVHMEINHR
jgi:hypothetical protein